MSFSLHDPPRTQRAHRSRRFSACDAAPATSPPTVVPKENWFWLAHDVYLCIRQAARAKAVTVRKFYLTSPLGPSSNITALLAAVEAVHHAEEHVNVRRPPVDHADHTPKMMSPLKASSDAHLPAPEHGRISQPADDGEPAVSSQPGNATSASIYEEAGAPLQAPSFELCIQRLESNSGMSEEISQSLFGESLDARTAAHDHGKAPKS